MSGMGSAHGVPVPVAAGLAETLPHAQSEAATSNAPKPGHASDHTKRRAGLCMYSSIGTVAVDRTGAPSLDSQPRRCCAPHTGARTFVRKNVRHARPLGQREATVMPAGAW